MLKQGTLPHKSALLASTLRIKNETSNHVGAPVRILIVLFCLFGLSSCKALFGNYTTDDLERKRVAWFSADQPPKQLEDHTFFQTTPIPQQESGFVHRVQYFSPDGTFHEFQSGDSLIKSGTWIKKSTDGFFSKKEEICFYFSSNEECVDFDDWSGNNMSSYRTDYLNLGSRKFAPCRLGSSVDFFSRPLVILRKDLNRSDTEEESRIDCRHAFRSIVAKNFYGDETTVDHELNAIVKHMFYCMRSLPDSSLLASEDDRDQFRRCNHRDMRPIAIQRLHESLVFGTANRDYSIYGKARRAKLGVD